MKSDAVYKQAFNDALTIIGGVKRGERIPSESVLSAHLAVSRTMSKFAEDGLVEVNQRHVRILDADALRRLVNPTVCA